MVYRTAPVELGANPLVNDDQYLNNPGLIEFGGSPAGLDLSMGQQPPLGMQSANFGGLESDPGVQAIMRTAAQGMPTQQEAPQQQGRIFYSPSTGDMVVNGYQFNERNASNALESEAYARQPLQQFQLPDTADDWTEMSNEEYAAYIDSIRNPGLGRRVSEAWEHAWRGFGDVNLGAALAVNPDWEWAQTARENLAREFHENAPFMVGLRDIQNPGDAGVFAMQMGIQVVPWVAETIAAMVFGAVAGGIVSGGVGAPAGAVEGLIVREGLRRATTSVLSSRLRAGAAAYSRILTQTGASQLTRQQALAAAARNEVDDLGRFFDFSERLYHFSRGADNGQMLASWGARAGSAASNYSMAVGDIRNSIADAGGDPTTANSIANIWGGAIPYAILESYGDLIWTAPLSRTMPELFQGGRGLAGRAANAGIVGISEAGQEVSQSIITEQATANATDTPLELDPINLLEAGLGGFFGGAALGGVLGGRGPTPSTGEVLPTTPTIPAEPRPDPAVMPPEDGYEGRGYTDADGIYHARNPFSDSITMDPPSVPGAGTGVSVGNLYVPQNAGVPPAAGIFDDTYVAPDVEIPGQVDVLGEPLVPGQPSAARPPGWPPPPPANLSTEFPAPPAPPVSPDTDLRAPTGTELQRINEQRASGAALRVLADRNPRLAGAFNEVLTSVQSNLFINTNVLSELPLVQQETTQRDFPAEHAALALMVPGQMRQLIIEHNDRMLSEAMGMYDDARNVATWTREQLERFQALAGSILTKGKAVLKPAQRTNLMKVQTIVGDRLRSMRNIAPANDGLRGRTEEATPQQETQKTKKLKKGKKKNKRQRKMGRAIRDAALRAKVGDAEFERMRREAQAVLDEELQVQGQPMAGSVIEAAEQYIADRKRAGDKWSEQRERLFLSIVNKLYGDTVLEDEILDEIEAEEDAAAKAAENFRNKELYPAPPPNPEFKGKKVVAVSKEGVIEEATFITETQDIPFEYAEGKKVHAKAFTYYVYNGTPVRRDIFENTREPVEGSKFGQSGKFRVKAGVPFDGVIVEGSGKVKTLEEPNKGQDYNDGDLILTGWAGEKWPQSPAKAEQKYTITPVVENPTKSKAIEGELIGPQVEDDAIIRTEDDTVYDVELTYEEDKPQTFGRQIDEYANDEDLPPPTRNVTPKEDIETDEPVSEMPKSERLKAAARRAAEAMKAEPKAEPKAESGSDRSEVRIETAYKKLVAQSKDLLKDPGQRARKYIQTIDGNQKPGKETREWAEIDGKLLTADEARALADMFPPHKGSKPQPKKPNKLSKEARRARAFILDIVQLHKDSSDPAKGTPEMFAQDVRENATAAQEWLNSPEKPGEAAARSAVSRILRESPTQASMNKGQSGQYRRIERLWAAIKTIGPKQPSSLNKNQEPYFPSDWREQILAMKLTVAGLPEFRSMLDLAHTFRAAAESDTQVGREIRAFGYLEPWMSDKAKAMAADEARRAELGENVLPFKKPIKNVLGFDRVAGDGITLELGKRVVKHIQRVIAPAARVRTTHVFRNAEELIKNRANHVMIASNGAEITLDRWLLGVAERMRLEHKELKHMPYEDILVMIRDGHLDFRAAIVNGFNALIVFTDSMKSEDDLIGVLEHEIVVHSGLRAIFPTDEDREMFLGRVLLLPGMEARVQALLHRFPAYRQYTIFEQVEEVIAFHAMEGPLALEALLSAKAGIDAKTRETLWDTLVRLWRQWVGMLYADSTPSATDMALDVLVGGLRQHAITGSTTGFNDALTIFSQFEMDAALVDRLKAGVRNNDIVKTATEATPLTQEEYNRLLYGYDENAARAYQPMPWTTKMRETLDSNIPTVEKLQELLKRAGSTTLKEKVRATLRTLETMNSMGERSVLIKKLMDMMHRTIHRARELMTARNETRIYARKSKQAHALGSTEAERDGANKMMVLATSSKMPKVSEQVIQANMGLVTTDAYGMRKVNHEFKDKLIEKSLVPKQEFKDGMETYTVTSDGELVSQGKHKLPAEMVDASYDKIYVPETKHMANSAVEELEGALDMLNQMNDVVVQDLVRDIEVNIKDKPFFEESLRRIRQLYADIAFHEADKSTVEKLHTQLNKARQVMVELMRAYWVPEKAKDWTDTSRTDKDADPRTETAFKWRNITGEVHEDVKPFVAQIGWFLEVDAATGKSRIERMSELGVTDTQQYDMLNAFQNIITVEMDVRQRERQVIQSILGNYVEFTRRGKWRVYVEVLDAKTGKRAEIGPDLITSLPIIYPENESAADVLQQGLQAQLKGTYKIKNVDGNEITIKFNVKSGRAPGTQTLAEAPNVKQFLDVARIINLKLTAPQMKEIANLIENAGGRRRFGLQRSGIPGMDANILRSNSEVMTRRAWTAAKMSESWALNRLFDDRKNLYGDPEHLEKLQRDFDIANRGAPEGQPVPSNFVRNEEKVYYAEKALLMYANQMKHMMEKSAHQTHVVVRTTTGTKRLKIEPEAQVHHREAIALRESLKAGELELNLNDLLSKTGPLRMATVAMQLGSIGSGIMQAFSLFTHLPVLLTAKHHRTGYGEGYGVSEVMGGLMTATVQVGRFPNMDDAATVHAMLEAAKKGDTSSGMTQHELAFIYKEILTGVLGPQQTYSMTGGTESSITNLALRNLAEFFMLPFSKVESMVRRAAALLIYRLAKARYIRAGVSEAELNDPTSEAYAKLTEDVRRPIFQSQGDYSNINRAKVLRGDIGQYFGMYKMFPIMTQIMTYNLPLQNQLAFLTILFLLAGLKGEPFADDFMDIYDTLLQKLGFQHDSVELQLIQALEAIQPGLSKIVMHGFIDGVAFGGTMSTRIAMGDIIPGTGMFREGADPHRELTSAFGPAYAGNVAMFEWAWLATDFTLQTLGIKNRTNNWEDLVRRMPQAQLRGLGEAALMWRDGQIVDANGRLVSDDVTAGAIFMRALGFYPIEATNANTAVRLDRMHLGYMRAVRARYVLAYAAAYRAGDQDRMDRIADDVRRWNEVAEETGQDDMKITNFRAAGVRAGRAASQTTVERASRSAPDYSVIDEVAAALNADEEADD